MERKYQNLTGDTSQRPVPPSKINYGNNVQNLHKSRYQNFLVLPNFVWFSYFWQNILSLIVELALTIAIFHVSCYEAEILKSVHGWSTGAFFFIYPFQIWRVPESLTSVGKISHILVVKSYVDSVTQTCC